MDVERQKLLVKEQELNEKEEMLSVRSMRYIFLGVFLSPFLIPHRCFEKIVYKGEKFCKRATIRNHFDWTNTVY